MLFNAKKLETAELRAADGVIGRVDDFLFDDRFWHVRYAVIDTGGWLAGRRVLISPVALRQDNDAGTCLATDLTREQVRASPGAGAAAAAITREEEEKLHEYYRWPPYWGGVGGGFGLTGDFVPGPTTVPAPVADAPLQPAVVAARQSATKERDDDPHLRSSRYVRGHGIAATDGDIGHVEDLLIDPRTWQVRYLVIDTRNWWPGRKVLVAPLWLNGIDWKSGQVGVDLTRAAIKASPAYDPSRPVMRDYADELHRHYQRAPHSW